MSEVYEKGGILIGLLLMHEKKLNTVFFGSVNSTSSLNKNSKSE